LITVQILIGAATNRVSGDIRTSSGLWSGPVYRQIGINARFASRRVADSTRTPRADS